MGKNVYSKEILDLSEYAKHVDNLDDYARRNRALFRRLKEETNFLSSSASARQRLWHIEHNTIEPPTCKICSNFVKWHILTRKYQTYCSSKCAHNDVELKEKVKQTNQKKYGVDWNIASCQSRHKRQQTCIRRYGIDNPMKLSIVQQKQKQTMLTRYGVSHNWSTGILRDKQKQTMLERYEVESPIRSNKIKNKIKRTNLGRYGSEWNIASGSSRTKRERSCLLKYNTTNPFKSEKIKQKIKRSMLEKYGVNHPLKSDTIKEKIRQTCVKRYGVNHPTQQHMIKIISLINDYDWLFDQYINKNKTATQIASELGSTQETICRYLHAHEINIRQYTHSYKSIQWLESIMESEDIFIQHAGNIGEYQIPDTRYRADGYCKETNTVYEFHGDYWHGNPDVYDFDVINETTNCTMGELYQKTIERERILREMGYVLVIIWEKDYGG